MVLTAAVMPSARQVLGEGPQLRQLLGIVQKRLSTMVYVSMVGLIITGMLEARHSAQFHGLFAFSSAYAALLSVKHVLVIVMVAVALYRSLVLARVDVHAVRRWNVALLKVNVLAGCRGPTAERCDRRPGRQVRDAPRCDDVAPGSVDSTNAHHPRGEAHRTVVTVPRRIRAALSRRSKSTARQGSPARAVRRCRGTGTSRRVRRPSVGSATHPESAQRPSPSSPPV